MLSIQVKQNNIWIHWTWGGEEEENSKTNIYYLVEAIGVLPGQDSTYDMPEDIERWMFLWKKEQSGKE